MAQSERVGLGPFGVEHPLNWDNNGNFATALDAMRHSPTLLELFHPLRTRSKGGIGGSNSGAPAHQGSPPSEFSGLLSGCCVIFDLAAVYASVSLLEQVLAEERLGDGSLSATDGLPDEERVRSGRDIISSIRRTYWDAMCGFEPLGHSGGDSKIAEDFKWMPPADLQSKAMAELMRLQGMAEYPNRRVAVEGRGLMAQLGFGPAQTQLEGSDRLCIAACQSCCPADEPRTRVDKTSSMQRKLSQAICGIVDRHLWQCAVGRQAGQRSESQGGQGKGTRADEARTLLCLLLDIPVGDAPATLRETVMLLDPTIPRDLCLCLCGRELSAPGGRREGLNWLSWRLRNYSRCLALRWVFDGPLETLAITSFGTLG